MSGFTNRGTMGLTKFPEHSQTFAIAFVAFTVVHMVLAPLASKKWFPVAYTSNLKGRRARNIWLIHVVSQVHTVVIVPLALWVISKEGEKRKDKAFGWDDDVGFVHAIACGYFLWDTLDAVVNFIDLGFVVHGVACLAIYVMTFTPFLAHYGIRCLLWEISTFFLNNHWFLDKTGRAGSALQLVNGVFLILAFFGVRLIYGGLVSYEFLCTLVQVRDQVPVLYILVYGLGNIVLQGLNWFWFYKMIGAFKRRFSGERKDHAQLKDGIRGGAIDHGVDNHGHAIDGGVKDH